MTFHCPPLARGLLTLCTSLLISVSASVLAADRPNILVIMGDDIGITNNIAALHYCSCSAKFSVRKPC